MSDNSIHLINARSCIYLDVLKDVLGADSEKMFQRIRNDVTQLKSILNKKGVDYKSLRSVLSPSKVRKNKEIVLCFEAEAFGDCYGISIHNIVFPLINKKRSHVIQVGDLLYDQYYDLRIRVLDDQIIHSGGNHINPNRNYYLMYFNNITQHEIDLFENRLKEEDGYVGYCDISQSCLFRDVIANTLVQVCVQNKTTVILSQMGDECSEDENVNITAIDFEKYGFNFISIFEPWYSTYLEYKIPSSVADHGDVEMSLNSITNTPEDIGDYYVNISPGKFEYIKNVKKVMERMGLPNISREEFLTILNNQLTITTLCDMEFKDESNAVLFGTVFEYTNSEIGKTYAYLIGFQYKYLEKQLMITTMY